MELLRLLVCSWCLLHITNALLDACVFLVIKILILKSLNARIEALECYEIVDLMRHLRVITPRHCCPHHLAHFSYSQPLKLIVLFSSL